MRCVDKLITFINQKTCKHDWMVSSINFKNGKVRMICKRCGKLKYAKDI